jgi:hypothetical protein
MVQKQKQTERVKGGHRQAEGSPFGKHNGASIVGPLMVDRQKQSERVKGGHRQAEGSPFGKHNGASIVGPLMVDRLLHEHTHMLNYRTVSPA